LGYAKLSQVRTIQTFQSIALRLVTSAPWYISNNTLYNDLKIETVRQLAAKHYSIDLLLSAMILTLAQTSWGDGGRPCYRYDINIDPELSIYIYQRSFNPSFYYRGLIKIPKYFYYHYKFVTSTTTIHVASVRRQLVTITVCTVRTTYNFVIIVIK